MNRTSITGPRSGKIAAWHAPREDEPWYPVAGAKLAPGVAMFAATTSAVVLAVIRRHPERKTWWWYQLGVWGGAGWLRQEIPLEQCGCLTPLAPYAFRPVDSARWPNPLPEALTPALGATRPPAHALEPADGVDPHHGSDDWPYPGLALGLGAPASREECEARLLRAVRTSNAQGRVGHNTRSTCADIPRETVLAALKFAEQERLAQERAEGVARDLEAVRSGWTPTKRDLADWLTALGWLECAAPRGVRALMLRAADPPWSFRQIAERLRVKSHNTARGLYAATIAEGFYAATRGMG